MVPTLVLITSKFGSNLGEDSCEIFGRIFSLTSFKHTGCQILVAQTQLPSGKKADRCCDVCSRKFSNRPNVLRQRTEAHQGVQESMNVDFLEKFSGKVALEEHARRHAEYKPFAYDMGNNIHL